MKNLKLPAKQGCDYIRDANWQPIIKTRTAWLRYAAHLIKPKGFTGCVALIEFNDKPYYRISLAGQKESLYP